MNRFIPFRKPFSDMTPDELRVWLQQTQHQLRQKMQREQSYLVWRASKGRRTSTDEAYENDQILEQDILELLHTLENNIDEAEASS